MGHRRLPEAALVALALNHKVFGDLENAKGANFQP